MAFIVCSLVIGFAAAYYVVFGVAGPLRQSIESMKQLAAGDLNAEIAGVSRKNELGDMARAMQEFRDGMASDVQCACRTKRRSVLNSNAQHWSQRASSNSSALPQQSSTP